MTDAALKEVIVRALIIEGGYLEEYYKERDRQRSEELAKKLLSRGLPIDEIAEDTGLSYDIVATLA